MTRRVCQGTVCAELWGAASPDEWRTAQEIVRASGRNKNGGSLYSALLSVLVAQGALDFRQVQHINARGHAQGRPRKQYRRLGEVYYNTREDARFFYFGWEELSEHERSEAENRFEGQYPWLGVKDWLYPLTRGKDNPTRLAIGATRVLRITQAEAERKRIAWVEREAGWFLPA